MPQKSLIPPIFVSIDPNEELWARNEALRVFISKYPDKYTLLDTSGRLVGDLHFNWCGNAVIVEIKDFTGGKSDFTGSIFNGHMWRQCVAAAEAGIPYIIAVVGEWKDLRESIAKSLNDRGITDDWDNQYLSSFNMVHGFIANAEGLNIRVWMFESDEFYKYEWMKHLFDRVRNILQGGNIRSFAPHPAPEERKVIGFSIMAGEGIGPAKAEAILSKFRVVLQPIEAGTELTDCKGIGKELGGRVAQRFPIR